jgi:hypothetical protein
MPYRTLGTAALSALAIDKAVFQLRVIVTSPHLGHVLQRGRLLLSGHILALFGGRLPLPSTMF